MLHWKLLNKNWPIVASQQLATDFVMAITLTRFFWYKEQWMNIQKHGY